MSAIRVEPISEEDTERLKKSYPVTFVKFGQRYIRTVPGNSVLPASYEKVKDRFQNWDVRPDDTYVLSFPKNGTTWTQELVWCVQNGCDIEKAKSIQAIDRVPFVEISVIGDFMKDHIPRISGVQDPIGLIENMPSPRIIKSHLAFHLFSDDLFEKSKVVLCLRNPKDTVVSYYHHEKLMNAHGYAGDFPTYFGLFMDNLLIYSPYCEYVVTAWQKRNHPNLCILFYEDMKLDLAGNIRKVATFLGKEITEEQIETLLHHLSFKKMKENKSVNLEVLQDGKVLNKEGSFIRKGEVGDWKNYFTDEMNERMDEAIEKYFKPISLQFRYE